MTQEAILKMLAIMRATWPRFYNQQPEGDLLAAAHVWFETLKDEDEQIVLAALNDYVRTGTFPPVPADICKRIDALKSTGEPDANAMFELVRKAVSDSAYHAQERFDALPPICQAFVGSASALVSMGRMDEDTLLTVTRGQFFKQFAQLKDRERMTAALPDNLQKMLSGALRDLPGV